MSLLQQIQEDASNSTARVADLLRKCKILAARLQSAELEQWVMHELEGYPLEEQLPTYRVIKHINARGNFYGGFGAAVKNGQISTLSLPSVFDKWLNDIPMREGIVVYEELLRSSDLGAFQNTWPVELLQLYNLSPYEGMRCMNAWGEIPRGSFLHVIDSVKNKILEFSLEIYKQNPEAGEAKPDTVPVLPATVSNVFNNTFHGSVGNVAAGSHGFSQQATVQQLWAQTHGAYDLPTLARELGQVRQAIATQASEPEQLEDLSAVTLAEIAAKKNDGPKMLEHLKDFGKWGAGVATTVGAGTLLAMLKQHLGLH